MSKAAVGEQLVRELLTDPRRFSEQGRAYQLLLACFDGFPVESLRPLLKAEDSEIQGAAAYVASELGQGARSLVDDVIPLAHSQDRRTRYDALEVIAVCSLGERAHEYVHVILALEDADVDVRVLVMLLVSKAASSQLEAAARFFGVGGSHHPGHERGLSVLLVIDQTLPEVISEMFGATDPLVRRYAAIAAFRSYRRFPFLIHEVASSDDTDVRRFTASLARRGLVQLMDADLAPRR